MHLKSLITWTISVDPQKVEDTLTGVYCTPKFIDLQVMKKVIKIDSMLVYLKH